MAKSTTSSRPTRAATSKAATLATKVKKSPGAAGKRGRKPGSTSIKVNKAGRKLKKRRHTVASQMRLQRERTKARRAKATSDDEVVDEDGKKRSGASKKSDEEPESDDHEWEAEMVVGLKLGGDKLSYLVKWVDYPHSQNSWEPEDNLANSADLIADFEKRIRDAQALSKP